MTPRPACSSFHARRSPIPPRWRLAFSNERWLALQSTTLFAPEIISQQRSHIFCRPAHQDHSRSALLHPKAQAQGLGPKRSTQSRGVQRHQEDGPFPATPGHFLNPHALPSKVIAWLDPTRVGAHVRAPWSTKVELTLSWLPRRARQVRWAKWFFLLRLNHYETLNSPHWISK